MTPPTSQRERELKLDLPMPQGDPGRLGPGSVGPDEDDLLEAAGRSGLTVTELPAEHLVAQYLDTADGRMARWGVTLRRREGGHDAGWHLKLPATPHAGAVGVDGLADRIELHLPLTEPIPAGTTAPPEFVDLVTALTRGRELVHLARVETARFRFALSGVDGVLLAEAVVDDVLTERPDGAIERWREAEVEVLGGKQLGVASDAVERLGREWQALGAKASTRTKGQRALGAAASGPPDVVVAQVDQHSDERDLLRHAIARQVRSLLWADLAVRRGAPDGIHRFRVAARTLRSLLRTFEAWFDPEWARGLTADLAEVAGALGTARDAQVQRESFAAALDALAAEHGAEVADAAEVMLAWLDDVARDSAKTVLAALRAPAYGDLLERLVAAAREPRWVLRTEDSSGPDLAAVVSGARRALRRRVARLVPGEHPRRWHRARIRAKRARYAADAWAAGGRAKPVRWAEELSETTDALGAIHDDAVSLAVLRDVAERCPDGRTGFALGLLHAAVATRMLERQRAFAPLTESAR